VANTPTFLSEATKTFDDKNIQAEILHIIANTLLASGGFTLDPLTRGSAPRPPLLTRSISESLTYNALHQQFA